MAVPIYERPIVLSSSADKCAFESIDPAMPGVISLTCRCPEHTTR